MESVLIESLRYLVPDYEITILSLYYPSHKSVLKKLPPSVNVIELQISHSFTAGLPFFSRSFFNKVIGNKRYDYLIALKPDTMNVCFSNRGTYKIYWCHNDYHIKYAVKPTSFVGYFKKLLLRLIYQKHTMVWSVTQQIINSLTQAFSLNNAFTLPNPIDCKSLILKSNVPCDICFDREMVNIVMVGRIAIEKGFDRVVRLFTNGTLTRYPNVRLYIVGDGGERRNLEVLINEANLSSKIHILGFKSNPYPYLKQASLFVLPSHYESFGLAVLEAMLLKIPVIATDTTGGKYVTQNGQYAYCVENTDEALTNAITSFLDNPNKYPFDIDAAQQWALSHSSELFGSRIIQLLDKRSESHTTRK